MHIILAFIFFTTFDIYHCEDIKDIFEKINKKVEKFNAIGAEIAWGSTVDPGNPELVYKSAIFQKENVEWQHRTCDELGRQRKLHLFNSTQARQTYLLCRGPKYTYEEVRLTSALYEKLQSIYNDAKICIPTEKHISPTNLTEIETAILKYLKSAKYFLKNIYHLQDPMFAVKNAVKEETGVCLDGENDFQNIMMFSRNEQVLRWLWLVWREKVGPPMKAVYKKLVDVENVAARRNGYRDIGASWRDELEVPSLRQACRRLYEDMKPLYSLLHGVTRFYLRREYGDVVPEFGPIPAHLLGNLWSQSWEPLADLILTQNIDLDGTIAKLNWTVEHMVKRAEDFYQSLGLPPMKESFWSRSLFSRPSNRTRCHGSAADMYKDGDFRLVYCSGSTKDDFYVLHHELGHIQYYMAYKQQPALFRQANSALHEAIGDTIMYGVMTPQHLHRLGLINDTLLYSTNDITIQNKEIDEKNKVPEHKEETKEHAASKEETENAAHKEENREEHVEYKEERREEYVKDKEEIPVKHHTKDEDEIKITTDEILLLKQALSKIPQIPFSLVIDEYRWEYFEGDLNMDVNKRFWELSLELQGIAPPVERGENYFDAGAKFHVPDNTPYIRYFLSSFLQHQLFETICKGAVFGRRGAKEPLPNTITMNRCDIYGSKTAGKILKDIMSRGHSQNWRQILQETTGQDNISAAALKRYYRPLYAVLEKLVRLYRIPIGW